jgi:hypothetical protein
MFARRWVSSIAIAAPGIQTADAGIVPWKTSRPEATFGACSYVDSYETSSTSYPRTFLRTLRAKWQTSSIERPGISTEGKTTPS